MDRKTDPPWAHARGLLPEKAARSATPRFVPHPGRTIGLHAYRLEAFPEFRAISPINRRLRQAPGNSRQVSRYAPSIPRSRINTNPSRNTSQPISHGAFMRKPANVSFLTSWR